VVRTVPNPVILVSGVISCDLDHPVFRLVCSPSIGVVNWSDTFWSYVSPWGQFPNSRQTHWPQDDTYHSAQVRIYPSFSMNWREYHTLDVDTGVPLTMAQLESWETSILRHYFEWKVSNLRRECCEFLRDLIRANTGFRLTNANHRALVYVFGNTAPAHRNLVLNKSAAYEYFGY
jgi:hypothetical protein